MFEIGQEYRVFPQGGGSRREGKLVETNGPMFMLDVDGVRTIFHMTSVVMVELIDRDAESAREKAKLQQRKEAWS